MQCKVDLDVLLQIVFLIFFGDLVFFSVFYAGAGSPRQGLTLNKA